MTNHKLRSHHLFYILFAVFYLWLAAQIPYTHDDWDWGLDIGMQQWLTASVNSRYVGNFFEIIMTRSVFLKTVIMGWSFFLLPYLLSHIAAGKNKTNQPLLFLAANFLILTMSRLVWSETYGWIAGFANFGLSSIFTLLCFTQWLPLCDTEYRPAKHGIGVSAAWCLISFLGQLFIENLSIIMAAASVAACLISYLRAKKIPAHYFFMSIGMVFGLCIMFSSSVYDSLFGAGEAVDGYRQLIVSADGGIGTKLYNIFVQAARLATRAGEANFVLCISVLAVLTFKLMCSKNSDFLRKAFMGINILFALYFTVNYILQTDYTPDRILLSAFAAMVNALYFLTVAVEVFLLYRGFPHMQCKLIAVWMFGIALLAPLVVTNEAGYRLIFSLNIMVSLFILFILQDLVSLTSVNKLSYSAFLCAAVIPAVVCIFVYSAIGQCNTLRLELIEIANFYNGSEITLPAYPYENYLHAPDPVDAPHLKHFKEFYGIEENVNLIFESIE